MTNLLFYTPVDIRFGSGFEEWLKKTCFVLRKKANVSLACGSIGQGSFRWTTSAAKDNFKICKGLHFLTCLNFFSFFHPLSLKFVIKLYKIIKQNDIVYFNCAFFFHDVTIFLLAKIAGKKIIFGFHAPIFFDNFIHNLYFRFITFFILKFVDAVHVNNSSDKRLLNKVTAKPIFLIPNYILKKEIPIKISSNFTGEYVFAGRFDYQKGIDLLAEVIRLVLNKNQNIKFLFFGKGSMQGLLNNLQKDFPKNVKVFPYEPDKDKIYNNRKFVLLPSRQETFSMIPLEAMTRGIPLITTNSYGQKDIISGKIDGLLIKKIDAQSLTDAIFHAETITRSEYLNFSSQARKKITENYTEENFLPRFLKMVSF